MAYIALATDGQLSIECEYEEKEIVKEIGGRWDGVYKVWNLAFTIDNLEYLLDNLSDVDVSAGVEAKVASQTEKEKKLKHLRALSKNDTPVRLKVPGLHLKQQDGTKMSISPYNYQKLGIMFALTHETGEGVLIADEMGLGKAGSVDSKLLTPSGFIRMGDVEVGDFVIGRNGRATRVTGVYPQGKKDIYKVSFTDGSSTECCEEHLWEVNTPTRKNRGNPPLVKTLREIIDSGLTRKNGKNGARWNWYIPMVDPVEMNHVKVPIDPYLLGCLIGDGCFRSGTIGFTSVDKEILESIRSVIPIGLSLNKKSGSEKDYLISGGKGNRKNELIDGLRMLGLWGRRSSEKFVPDIYKNNSLSVRIAILQGLMDTDGTVGICKRGNVASFCTTSERLRDDVVWICRSLGGTVSFSEKSPFYYDDNGKRVRGRQAWILNLSVPNGINPFRMSRKSSRYPNNREKYSPSRAISSIEKVGVKDAQCISVEAKDSLYVADDFIVTHNTLQAICTAIMLKQQGRATNALIVTPASLKYNWPMEIEKFTDEPYVVIDGKKPDDRIAQWMRDDVFFTVVNYELLLEDLFGGRTMKPKEDETEEQKQRREARMMAVRRRQRILTPVRTKVWDFIACDEAHAMKNSRSKRTRNVKSLKASFRMALTGTPLDGRLEELHSVMEWVMPGLLESKTRFIQKYAITDFFGKVTGYRNIHEVTEKIAPYFIRRLKKDVLQDLPDKIYQNRIVVLSDKEKRIYKALAEAGHEATEDAQALTCVLRCKQFCDHPELVGEDIKGAKYEALREVLEEVVVDNGNKALIFTQFKEMLEHIVVLLDEMGLEYLRIDGDCPKQDRAEYQTRFNNDASIDLMIGTEAMSTGLNFTSASYVINYDDNWAPAFMAQREDRAHRIGQKDVVTVINFICKDTIEERIRSVLYAKNVVSSEALGDDVSDAVLRRITPKEQAALL